jgi:hypothetical protein
MTGYDAFLVFQAIKLHFTSESYDYFKYQKKYNCAVSTYEHRNDRYMYHKLCRKYPQHDDLEFFLAANFFTREGKKLWVGDLLKDDAYEVCLERRKIKESLEYTVTEELKEKGIITPTQLTDVLKVHEGNYPTLLTYAMHHEIHPETLLAIDSLTNCLDVWSRKISDTIIYPQFKLRYRRYLPFMSIDQKSLSQSLRQYLCETK